MQKKTSPMNPQNSDLKETKDETQFDTDSIKHSLLAARSSKSKTSIWNTTYLSYLKLLTRIPIRNMGWYESNTRHHASIFEQHNLARDIRYVWSFFSGQ